MAKKIIFALPVQTTMIEDTFFKMLTTVEKKLKIIK